MKIVEKKRALDQGGRTVLRPRPGSEVVVAIDLSRSKYVYCVRWEGSEQRRVSTPAGVEQAKAVIGQYGDCRLRVAYEACGFGYELAWWLESQGIATTVIAPSRVERAPGLGVKTDRLDVGKMARKLEEGQLRGIYIPPRELHEERQIGRTYAQCLKERKRAQIRIRSLMQEQGLLGPVPAAGWSAYSQWLAAQTLAKTIEHCVESLQRLRQAADAQAHRQRAALQRLAQRPEYAPLVAALTAQPGVGTFSAIRLILELGDIGRFPRPESLPRYLGLTPSEYSSGELVHRGHLLKCGPGALRGLLLQCAWAAVSRSKDRKLREIFETLAPRIGRKRAIIAVARRLSLAVHHRWVGARENPSPIAV